MRSARESDGASRRLGHQVCSPPSGATPRQAKGRHGGAIDDAHSDACGEWDAEQNEAEFFSSLSPLVRAAAVGNLDRVRTLIAAGADPNDDDCLVAAAEAGSLACVRALLTAGADPSAHIGDTSAADLARRQGFPDVATYVEGFASSHPAAARLLSERPD